MENIKNAIKEIVEAILYVNDVDESTKLVDLGFDKLDLANLVLEIELRFKLDIADNAISLENTLNEIYEKFTPTVETVGNSVPVEA